MSMGKRRLVVVLTVMGLWMLFPPSAMAAKKKPYGPYRAMVVRVLDGDTVEVDVWLWPGLVQRIKLRLAGVNTPEKRGRGSRSAKRWPPNGPPISLAVSSRIWAR